MSWIEKAVEKKDPHLTIEMATTLPHDYSVMWRYSQKMLNQEFQSENVWASFFTGPINLPYINQAISRN